MILFINYARKYNLNFRIARYHNVYGPRMGFEHVIPQLSDRAVNKEDPFNIYGGDQTRTFCYVDDAVRATCLAMRSSTLDGQVVNIGSDEETKIIDVANIILELSDYKPEIEENYSPPGSTDRRCPNIDKLTAAGFEPEIDLREGIEKTYKWYKQHYESLL